MAEIEILNVPIPKDRLQEVYELLARRRSSPERESTVESIPVDWSESLLARAYRESPPPMRKILDYLAERPDKLITSEQLAKAISRSRGQLAGVLGAFGRRWRNRYKQPAWPFSGSWDGEQSMHVYSMDKQTAASIKKARSV